MADFEDRPAAIVAELRSTEGITVHHASEGSLATWLTGPGHALEVIRKAAGVHLAPLMAGNFHRYNELHCYWWAADGTIGGEFWLKHLVNVCVDSVPDGLSDAEWPVPERGFDRLGTSCEVFDPDGEERIVSVFDGQGLVGTGAVVGFAELRARMA
ncbi:hypothetical protein GCM10023196_012460 [Actinoallomurus vinaceus]|uniref:Uncharacterized protein n=1 Tax=Actinoallomurus vinaceus TaxID=1080074 RepID=A0ABP8U2I4_9ACTN